MIRWTLLGVMFVATVVATALAREHAPHLVVLAVFALLFLPTGLLMEANLDRRRERKRPRRQ